MEVVNLELAKKLSRRKFMKYQTVKMFQKRNNCTVYDLKDNYKGAPLSYDAPNLTELKKISEYLKFASHFILINDVNEYGQILLKLLKRYKINLVDVRI
jgi:hypothetical protein